MWLSDKGKQAFDCTERQPLENTAQKGPNGYFTFIYNISYITRTSYITFLSYNFSFIRYFTVAKKESILCAVVLNL